MIFADEEIPSEIKNPEPTPDDQGFQSEPVKLQSDTHFHNLPHNFWFDQAASADDNVRYFHSPTKPIYEWIKTQERVRMLMYNLIDPYVCKLLSEVKECEVIINFRPWMISPGKEKEVYWKQIADYWYPRITCKEYGNDKHVSVRPGLFVYKHDHGSYWYSNSMHEKTMCGIREVRYEWDPAGFLSEEKIGNSVMMGSYNESKAASFNIEGMVQINDCFSLYSAVYYKFQTVLDNHKTIPWNVLQGTEKSTSRKRLRP